MWKNEEPSYSTLTNFLKSVKVGRLVGGDNLKYSGIPFDKITSYFLVGHNLDRLKSIRTINYSLKYLTEEQIEKIEEIILICHRDGQLDDQIKEITDKGLNNVTKVVTKVKINPMKMIQLFPKLETLEVVNCDLTGPVEGIKTFIRNGSRRINVPLVDVENLVISEKYGIELSDDKYSLFLYKEIENHRTVTLRNFLYNHDILSGSTLTLSKHYGKTTKSARK